ncbi:hypothetical protein Tco_0254930, partial [Tanacetum coccineum]
DKDRGILGLFFVGEIRRVPRLGTGSCWHLFRKHGYSERASANNPSKQKACQQSVELTVKRKGAKDAIKALTSKLQSMSPRAFMRKQAKAHVDTPTCARQFMYSLTYGTCDIEARDINNLCNATPVPVLHTSHGVNTSPSDDTGDKNRGNFRARFSLLMNRYRRAGDRTCDIKARDINNSCNATPVAVLYTSHGVNTSPSDDTRDKNRGISGSISLLMNQVPRWGQLQSMSPRAFMRKQAKAHVDTTTCARQLMYSSTYGTCDIEAKDINNSGNATPLQSMSPRAFMLKQAKAHVDTPTCARQLMYSSTHRTYDIEAKDINNSCNATLVSVLHISHGVNTSPSDVTRDKNRGILGSSSLLMNRVPRWGQVSSPVSFRKHGKEESSSNNPSKQKACQQSVEPTVKRKGAKDAIKALTSKLQSMSPRAFMRKQAKAHVDTPTCARELMYSSTYGT